MAAHELFPLPPDFAGEEDPREFVTISVEREERTGWTFAPRLFRAEELPDRGALHALFGGGVYRLIARDGKGKISARNEPLRLPGAAKPLDGMADAPAATAAPLADLPSTGLPPWLQALLPFAVPIVVAELQHRNQIALAVAQERMRSEERQQSMMLMVMGNQRQDAATLVNAMAQVHRPAGSESTLLEALKTGVAIGKSSSGSDDGTMLAALSAAAQVGSALKDVAAEKKKAAPVPVPQAPPPAPVPMPQAVPAPTPPATASAMPHPAMRAPVC